MAEFEFVSGEEGMADALLFCSEGPYTMYWFCPKCQRNFQEDCGKLRFLWRSIFGPKQNVCPHGRPQGRVALTEEK